MTITSCPALSLSAISWMGENFLLRRTWWKVITRSQWPERMWKNSNYNTFGLFKYISLYAIWTEKCFTNLPAPHGPFLPPPSLCLLLCRQAPVWQLDLEGTFISSTAVLCNPFWCRAVINPAKWVSGTSKLDFLDHRVSTSGISPLPSHVDSLQWFPQLTDIKSFQQGSGLGELWWFLPSIAAVSQLLTDALQGSPCWLEWSAAMAAAFTAAKQAIATSVPYAHHRSNAALSLMVDASDTDVGPVLQQHHSFCRWPIAFSA